jgi:hypothetical protein
VEKRCLLSLNRNERLRFLQGMKSVDSVGTLQLSYDDVMLSSVFDIEVPGIISSRFLVTWLMIMGSGLDESIY